METMSSQSADTDEPATPPITSDVIDDVITSVLIFVGVGGGV